MTETDLIDDLSRSDLPRGLRAVMIAGALVGLRGGEGGSLPGTANARQGGR